MPTLGKPKRAKWLGEKRKAYEQRKVDNSKKYSNQSRWRKTSKNYRLLNPLCEICYSKGLFEPVVCTDHIIPVSMGGSWYDERNHMGLCDRSKGTCHPRKSAKEKKGKPLIDWMYNADGEKIPKDRTDIFKVLNK